ncbi:MAG: helix-turn-helix domain-containing protein [Halioglobus sp.]
MDPSEFVSSYIEAWNNRDSQAIANHLADGGTYFDSPAHQQLSREQLVEHLEAQFERNQHVYEVVGEVLMSENTIAFQYKATPLNPKGDQVTEISYGAEFISLRSGVAVEILDYYDPDERETAQSPLSNGLVSSQIQRYAKSGLSAQQMEKLQARLSELMETDKLYLVSNLTLPELAEALGCTVNHLSQAINAGFGVSFFDYINQYRVTAAMVLLRAPDSESQTVLDIALGVGFNSTSTFYVAFKKVSGQTPAQYRRSRED